MKFKFILLFLSFQAIGQIEKDSIEVTLLKDIIYYLSQDSLQGRMSGSEDEKKALSYIQTKMDSLGKNRFFRQEFSIQKDKKELNITNGYVFINNYSNETILLSAHYDHIGFGNGLSTKFKDNEIHNGADDNASGVALIMLLYKDIIENGSKDKNYLFAFYSGHEIGLYGSEYFSKLISKKKKKFKEIIAVINFDMVGRMDNDLKILKCFANPIATSHFKKMETFRTALNLKIEGEEKLKLLDTKPFINKKSACFSFTTGTHLDYHAPDDDAKYINLIGLFKIFQYTRHLIATF
ncbi:Peptidase family M28 [Flavobacterium sp. 9AF]|uniref:M28 family peptidase n=1 Tax=Flavobacterium sp. 9AF TaxID=2653142 RepID=UPI0012F2A587|nr:M28 family peptidase [Flavobacterium sp. 9AF]VXB35295.1 Peptidase family M28 [Flavobacterium sp. 9AF]